MNQDVELDIYKGFDPNHSLYIHGGRNRYDNGRGGKKGVSKKKSGFRENIHDLAWKPQHLDAEEIRKQSLMIEIASIAQLSTEMVDDELEKWLEFLVQEQVELLEAEDRLVVAREDLFIQLDENPDIAQAVEEWLPDNDGVAAVELLLATRLDELKSQGKPVDAEMYDEARILAEAIAFANDDKVTVDDLLGVARAMVGEIGAHKAAAEVRIKVDYALTA